MSKRDEMIRHFLDAYEGIWSLKIALRGHDTDEALEKVGYCIEKLRLLGDLISKEEGTP